MAEGGGETTWGNGQPGDMSYSGPENNFAPSYPVSPTSYGGGFTPPAGSPAGFSQPAGGYNFGDINPSNSGMNPTTAGGGFVDPSNSGSGGFDEAGFQGIDFGGLNLGGMVSSSDGQPAMQGSTASFDELGFTTGASTTGPGAAAISGLPGLDPNIDPNNPSNAAYGSNPQTPYGTRNPAYGEEGTPVPIGASGAPGARGAAPAGGADAGGILSGLGIKNPVGTALAAGGLAYSVVNGQQTRESTKTIEQQAAMLNDNGKQLMGYLQSGNLPPGLQASLTQATAAAKAKVIQNFASQGMNPDPTKNSALAAQLAQIDQQAIITTAQIGQQLMQTGVQQSGMASDLYKTLSNIDATQTASIGKAIAGMAAALNGGGGTTIKLGGAA